VFSFRAKFKESPNAILVGAFLMSSLICAYMLRILERPLSDVSGQNFHELWSSIWLVFVTMTTVGYGDIYPKSYGGRILGAFMCLWGVLVVSLFVVTISETLEFNHAEKNSYLLIKRLVYRQELRKSATQLIDSAYHLKLIERNLKNSLSGNPFLDSASDRSRKHNADFRFRRMMLEFKKKANEMRQFEDNTELIFLSKNVDDIGEELEGIQERQK
jgi:hypothetical protein